MKTPMTEERMGQIALLVVKDRLQKEGVRLKREDLRRNIGDLAQRIGVPAGELIIFTEELVRELVEKTFITNEELDRQVASDDSLPGSDGSLVKNCGKCRPGCCDHGIAMP